MQRSHSWRSARKPPRASEDYQGVTGYSVGYDVEDMLELDRLIAAKCKVPRAEMARMQRAAESAAGEAAGAGKE